MSGRHLLILGLVAVGALAAAWSRAADVIVLPDPTRPPNAVLRAMTAKNAGASAAPAASSQQAAEPASGASAPARPVKREARLTSVRVSANGHDNVALLDGQLVRAGDRVGDSTVASIDDNGVVLRGPKGLQRLSLTPEGSKRWPGMDSPAKSGGKETR